MNCKISDLIVDDKEVDYEKIMFSDKKAFDALPLEDRMRILERLQEQVDFMIERAKSNNFLYSHLKMRYKKFGK